MLDPFTAVSLASCVVQFTDFGIKVIKGTIELYNSVNGLNAEKSDLEFKINHVRKLAEKIIALDHEDADMLTLRSDGQLRERAKDCNLIAKDLLSLLDDLKVKQLQGPGRKWESFRKAVATLTPHNKKKIADLENKLSLVQELMRNEIQLMMRQVSFAPWRSITHSQIPANNSTKFCRF